MEPTKALVDQLYREEVHEARRMPLEEKLIAGARLFDFACRLMASGIQAEKPGLSQSELLKVVRERLDLARRLERSP